MSLTALTLLFSLFRSYVLILFVLSCSQTDLIVFLQRGRLSTTFLQSSNTLPFFNRLLQVSLKRSFGRPTGREPSASSPYRSILVGLLSAALVTCPNHLRRHLVRVISISSTSARFKISSLLIANVIIPSYSEYSF